MQTAKLGTLVRIIGGGTPDRNNPEYWDGDIPWVTVKDVQSSRITSSQESITEKGLRNSASNLIPAGSIIVPTRMALGKVAINQVPIAINQDLKALTVQQDSIDRDYLHRFLLSKSSYLESRGKGATVKGITLDVLTELDVPIPSLPEQHRLAAILDKADAIRRKRREALNLADEFLRAAFLDMFGDPIANSYGWPVMQLGEVVSRTQIGPFGTQLHQEDYIEGGIPLVNPTHIVEGRICPDSSLTVSMEKYAQLGEYHLTVGDIVMGRRGEMGRCAIVSEIEQGYLCGTGSLFLRPDLAVVLSEYLGRVLSSDSAKAAFERASLGATMPNLNKSIVTCFAMGIPPLSLQQKYAQLDRSVIAAKAKLASQQSEAENLFASLSHRAFQGTL